jgi:hypothetical protein
VRQSVEVVFLGAAVNDLTLVYYTANRINERFQQAVMASLAEHSILLDVPVVIVSQSKKPEIVRHTIGPRSTCVVTWAEPSIWQVYQSILTAAKVAETEFIACCEDDTLYHPSHFTYRPAPDVFGYDRSRWVITRKKAEKGREAFYYWRERTQMAMCIAPRQLMIETLEEKFAKYPTPPESTDVAKKAGWGEPGRYEKNLRLTPRKREYFDSPGPSVTFNHTASLMGRRKVNPDDRIVTTLDLWGDATALWDRIHG